MRISLVCFLLLAYQKLEVRSDDIIVSMEDGIHPMQSCVGSNFHVDSPMKVIAMSHVKDLNLVVFIARERNISEIYAVSLDGPYTPSKLLKPEISRSHVLEDIAALDNGTVFVSDASQPAILRLEIITTPHHPPAAAISSHLSVFIQLEQEDRPRGLAVDTGLAQIGPALVWVNWRFGHQSIERVPLTTASRQYESALITEGLYLPHGVAVDSTRRLLYYSQLTEHSSRLHVLSAGADGSRDGEPEGSRRTTHLLYDGDWHDPWRSPVSLLRLSPTALYWTDGAGLWRLPRFYLPLVAGDEAPRLVAPGATAFCVLPAGSLCEPTTTTEVGSAGLPDSFNSVLDLSASSRLPLLSSSSALPWTSTASSRPSSRFGHTCTELWCLNGGTCRDSLATPASHSSGSRTGSRTPKCICRSGFTGARCGVDLCRQRCLNGGTCVRPSFSLSTPSGSVSGAGRPGEMTVTWSAHVDCVCPVGVTGDRCQHVVAADSSTVNCSLPLHMNSSQVVTSVSVLAVTAVFLLILLLLMVVGRRRLTAVFQRRRERALVLSDGDGCDRRLVRRRVVGGASTARLVLKSCSLATVEPPRPDIEDCCGMTLCERPCEVRIKSVKQNSSDRPSLFPTGETSATDEDIAPSYDDRTRLLLTVAAVPTPGKVEVQHL